MAQHTLSARIREQKGKEKAKKLRNKDQIPAIFYGPNSDPLMLSIENADLRKIMKKTTGENIILGLKIESEKGSDSKMVMLKDLQTDSIKDTYLHADFYEISMTQEITVSVPIHLVNTPAGVTEGGVLQQVRRELKVACKKSMTRRGRKEWTKARAAVERPVMMVVTKRILLIESQSIRIPTAMVIKSPPVLENPKIL